LQKKECAYTLLAADEQATHPGSGRVAETKASVSTAAGIDKL
jgi:hypothetical protein